MKNKAFLVVNNSKVEEANAHEVAGVFWKKSNAKKYLKQLMRENTEYIGNQLYKIEEYILPAKNSSLA